MEGRREGGSWFDDGWVWGRVRAGTIMGCVLCSFSNCSPDAPDCPRQSHARIRVGSFCGREEVLYKGDRTLHISGR